MEIEANYFDGRSGLRKIETDLTPSKLLAAGMTALLKAYQEEIQNLKSQLDYFQKREKSYQEEIKRLELIIAAYQKPEPMTRLEEMWDD